MEGQAFALGSCAADLAAAKEDGALPSAAEAAIEQAATPEHVAPLETAPRVEGAPQADHDSIWRAVLAAVSQSVRKDQFETWFRRAALRRIDERSLSVAVQNTFARDWLLSNYRTALEGAARAVLGGVRQVEIVVEPELTFPRAPAPDAALSEAAAAAGRAAAGPEAHNRLLWSSDVALNPGYTFDTFVVGPCNRFAHAAAVGVSEAPGSAYNPFFLHGSVGLGKTHLLQSLCFALLERAPQTRILYLSCETFINHFISALENGDLQRFRNKYRNVSVLVVDDIHMLANKERTQEEFFNTFNTLYNAGKQIVLSSDSPPKEIPTLQDRLVSRFKWGLVTEIESPCYETRMAIVRRKSRERGRELPEAVAHLIAEHIDSNIRELEGAVTRVIGFASLSGQEVSLDLARRVLRDVFSVQHGQPSMDDVMRVVTGHFNVKATDLQSRRRTNAIAHPRQVGMYLARRITRHSLEEIGGFFGGRDHTTVLHAVRKVESDSRRDERFRGLLASLLEQLQHS